MRNGAQGLKVFKNYGMDLKYANGERVHVDDPEFDAVWEKCAELRIPVLIHIADPQEFFEPKNVALTMLGRLDGFKMSREELAH